MSLRSGKVKDQSQERSTNIRGSYEKSIHCFEVKAIVNLPLKLNDILGHFVYLKEKKSEKTPVKDIANEIAIFLKEHFQLYETLAKKSISDKIVRAWKNYNDIYLKHRNIESEKTWLQSDFNIFKKTNGNNFHNVPENNDSQPEIEEIDPIQTFPGSQNIETRSGKVLNAAVAVETAEKEYKKNFTDLSLPATVALRFGINPCAAAALYRNSCFIPSCVKIKQYTDYRQAKIRTPNNEVN